MFQVGEKVLVLSEGGEIGVVKEIQQDDGGAVFIVDMPHRQVACRMGELRSKAKQDGLQEIVRLTEEAGGYDDEF